MSKNTRKCPVCGKAFVPDKYTHVNYCSDECALEGARRRGRTLYQKDPVYRKSLQLSYKDRADKAQQLFTGLSRYDAYKSATLLSCIKRGKLCKNKAWGLKNKND